MRTWIWIAGLLAFLAVTTAGMLVLPVPGGAVGARSAFAAGDSGTRPVPEGLEGTAWSGHALAGTPLDLLISAALVLLGIGVLWVLLGLWARLGGSKTRGAGDSSNHARRRPERAAEPDRDAPPGLEAASERFGILASGAFAEAVARELERASERREKTFRDRETALTCELERLRSEITRLTSAKETPGRSPEIDSEGFTTRVADLEGQNAELMRRIEDLLSEVAGLTEEVEGLRDLERAITGGNLPLPLVAVDAELRIFTWNPAATRFFGRDGTDLLGTSLEEANLRSTVLQHRLVSEIRRALELREACSTELEPFALEDERTVHVRIHTSPILSTTGRPLGAITSLEDSTEYLEWELECQVKDLYREGLVQSIPAALVVTDAAHRVVSWNEKARELLGLREEDVLGKDFRDLETPLETSEFRRRCEEGLSSGTVSRFAFSRKKPSPGARPVTIVTIAPFRTADGKEIGHVVMLERFGDGPSPAGTSQPETGERPALAQ